MTRGAPPSSPRHLRRQAALDRPLASTQDFPPAHLARIEASHARCTALGLSRIEPPDHAPLGRADLAVVRDRHDRLHAHAAPVMEMLFQQIAGTESMVVLCDDTGTIIHSVGDDDFLSRASKVALQPGVNWSEQAKGTNAIGTALIEEGPTLVHADEHYLHANHFLTCSATPILDPRGDVLGVLDVTGDHRSYHRHTMALVRMSARMIENQWLTEHCRHGLRLHFHARPAFIGTLMEGILALAPDGRVLGANRSALELIGLSGAALRMHDVASLFGVSVGALVERFRSASAAPAPLTTVAGRLVHVQARFDGPPWLQAVTVERPDPAQVAVRPADAPGVGHAAPAVRRTTDPTVVPPGLDALDTGDRQMAAVLDRARRVRGRDLPILVVGETGTGKDLLARAIHQDGQRHAQPFVAVHCTSAPAHLLEAELFGVEAGDLGTSGPPGTTGALVQAQGGTLYLDEIGDLPPPLQGRLLRVLQARHVTPPGHAGAVPLDVSIVCATQRDPRDLIAAKALREDLYHRLNGLTLRLPPLRERTDVQALAQRVLDADPDARHLRLSPAVLAVLRASAWPGNVRQLHNVLRVAAAMAGEGDLITEDHLPDDFLADARRAAERAPDEAPMPAPDARGPPGPVSLKALEVDAIRQALDAADGNLSLAARRLGVSRNTLYRRLRWSRDGAGR